MKDFFISYNKADRAWAEWIAWILEDEGYTTIIQAWDFRPGSNFVQGMQQGTSQAERTIAVISSEYLSSKFTQSEWQTAFAKDPTGEKGILLPIRVRECKPEGLLPQIVYIDLLGLQEEAAKTQLLAGIIRGRSKPEVKPPFPQDDAHLSQKKPRFPDTLTPVWNIPNTRNPNFTGREKILEALHNSLTISTSSIPHAINGLGGVGKTQLAIEYAYRHSVEYEIVWWLRSEDQATLANDYAGLATPLNLPEKDKQDQKVIVQAVRRWLDTNNRWLLIFDNAKDPAKIREYLPRSAAGHIIITTRNPAWGSIATPLHIKTMERYESVEYLQRRFLASDVNMADKLADVLGDLPLALAQAAGYIEVTGIGFREYVELFQTCRQALWEQETPPSDYPDSIATTWCMAMDKVNKDYPPAADLLNLLAFIAPDEFPRSIIIKGHKLLPSPLGETAADLLKFNRAVALLRNYALIDFTGDYFQVHRLVETVTRDRLTPDLKKKWAQVATRLVNVFFPLESHDVRKWPICAHLLPHALMTLNHAEMINCHLKQSTRLLNKIGMFLLSRRQFTEAKMLLQKAISIGEKTLGPDHPELASSFSNMGLVLKELSDYAGAKEHLDRARVICEKSFGQNHPEVATVINNIGSVLEDMGDYTGAKKNFELALSIDEKAYGPEHHDVARDLNNLGHILQQLGIFSDAQAYYRRALKIVEKIYGSEHPKVAIRLTNLGRILIESGDLVEAKKYFERSLEIDVQAYGPDHPEIATDLSNLSELLSKMDNQSGAKSLIERALTIEIKFYGPNHPNVARYLNNLGSVLQEMGDYVGAKSHYEKALRINQESLGDGHPYTAIVRKNLISIEEEKMLKNKSKKEQTVYSKKIGRNSPCPCGSNKKYKKCCGKATPDV